MHYKIEMKTSQQKAFRVLYQKQTQLSQCSVRSEQNLALIRLIVRAFDGGLDRIKRVPVGIYAQERVLEDLEFQRSKGRGFTIRLREAQEIYTSSKPST